jgi:hypothetical protein
MLSPGRFFAIGLMKLVFAAMVMRYDIKLVLGTEPKQRYFGKYTIPEFNLKLLIKAEGKESEKLAAV